MEILETPDLLEYYNKEIPIKLLGKTIPAVEFSSQTYKIEDIIFSIDGEFKLPIAIEDSIKNIIRTKKEHHFQTTGEEVVLFDGDVIRLQSIVAGKNLKVICQYSKYFYTYATNFSLEVTMNRNKTLRDIFAPGPNLPDLENCDLGNTLGINCVIISKDAKILFHKRSKKTSNAFGIHHSVGGSLKLNHINSGSTNSLINSVIENIREETGIGVTPSEVDIVGIARDMERGGIVDIYSIYYSKNNSQDLTDYKDSWEMDSIFWLPYKKLKEFTLENFESINSFTLTQIYFTLKHLS